MLSVSSTLVVPVFSVPGASRASRSNASASRSNASLSSAATTRSISLSGGIAFRRWSSARQYASFAPSTSPFERNTPPRLLRYDASAVRRPEPSLASSTLAALAKYSSAESSSPSARYSAPMLQYRMAMCGWLGFARYNDSSARRAASYL